MLQPILSNFFPSNQHQLFNRTRWRLAIWYAGMMGAVLVLSGLGVYHTLVYAYRLTISQELDLVANELHETLEPILKEPGKIDPEAAVVLPELCLVNMECWETTENKTDSGLQHQKYNIRLFDLNDNLIAVVGEQAAVEQKSQREQVAVDLHTKDFQIWGLLRVERISSEYATYMAYLHWIFIFGIPLLIATLMFLSWWLAGLAMQPIRQSYQLLQQFTADAAHELRTPLAAIGATVESTLMMPAITETDTQETLKTIGRQNGRLSKLVADLLMLCRMDRQLNATATTKITEQVSLNSLLEDIMEDFGSLAIKSKIKLELNLLVSQSLTIAGNYEQLYRLISNIVANALQYTNHGGKIDLTLSGYGKYATIKVADTGRGISLEELEKIFIRFYRTNSDRSRDTGGSGLGLSIAMAIAKAHQGTIKVNSIIGKGSTFTILLPTSN